MWRAAGAPGYTDDASVGAPPPPQQQAHSPPPPPPSPQPEPTPALWSRDAAAYPYVQMAVARVPARALPMVLHAYNTALAPAYAALPGFVSAQLLAVEVPPHAAPADIAVSALNAGRALVTLHNVTTWRTAAAFDDAQAAARASAAFRDALAAVAAHFVPPPDGAAPAAPVAARLVGAAGAAARPLQ